MDLAFKPETDDIREASSIRIIRELVREGARLRLYDPKAINNMKGLYPEEPGWILYAPSAYSAVEKANAFLLLTEWEEFTGLDLSRVKSIMANSIIVDGRNVFDPEKVRSIGFRVLVHRSPMK